MKRAMIKNFNTHGNHYFWRVPYRWETRNKRLHNYENYMKVN